MIRNISTGPARAPCQHQQQNQILTFSSDFLSFPLIRYYRQRKKNLAIINNNSSTSAAATALQQSLVWAAAEKCQQIFPSLTLFKQRKKNPQFLRTITLIINIRVGVGQRTHTTLATLGAQWRFSLQTNLKSEVSKTYL